MHDDDSKRIADRLNQIIETSENAEEALSRLDPETRELAERIGKLHAERQAINARLVAGLSPRGRLRRNASCPCGSGKKFKKCCLHDMKAKIHGDPTDTTNKEPIPDENQD